MGGFSPFHLRGLWRKGASADDFGPWFHIWGQAVHAHTAVIATGVASMLFTTLAITFKSGWLAVLKFSTDAVYARAEIWRVISYAVWNPPDIGFAVQMLVLWWFGREIEGFFGRRTFLQMFAGMLVLPALVALAVVKIPYMGPSEMAGLSSVSISLQFLVAYATLSPNVSFFYGIPIKWVAVAVAGIQALATIANRDWTQLAVELAGIGFAFSFVRNRMGLLELPTLSFLGRSGGKKPPTFTVVKKQETSALQTAPVAQSQQTSPTRRAPRTARLSFGKASPATTVLDSIDPLLEKISRSGMDSLSAEEKARLMAAREALLRETKD